MAKKHSLDSYRKVQLNTSSPGQQILLVYDGIIKSLNHVLSAFDIGDPSKFEIIHNGVDHTQQLIMGLKLALNTEDGSELAISMQSLYDFWIDHLSEANVRKDKDAVAEILLLVQDMRDTWEGVLRQAKKDELSSGQ